MQLRLPLSQPIETRDGTLTKDSKCVNGYFEMNNQKREFVKRPGLINTAATLPTGNGQGLTTFNGYLYAAIDNVIYKIDPTTFAKTTIGTMTGTVNGKVATCYFEQTLNNTYLFVHNQVNGYTITTSDVFAQVVNTAINDVLIFTGGTGYTAGDVLTIVGGTFTTAGTITVNTVDGSGVITEATLTNHGNYSVAPTNPVSVTGGTGSSAQFTADMNGFPSGNLVPGACYLDTYTVVGSPNGEVFTSDPNNPTSWNALNYITAEGEPDGLVGIAKHLNYVLAFGNWSIQFFYDSGASPGSPLANASSYTVELGCANGDSIASFENVVVFVGTSRDNGNTVYTISGTSPQKVSTPYIDRILNLSDMSDVKSYSMRINGHTFYVLTLHDLNKTLVLDMNEQVWYQWTMWAPDDSGNYGEQYFRPSYFASINGKYYMLDDDTGVLYEMSASYYTDNGAPIYYRSVSDIEDNGTTKRKYYRRLEIVGDKVPAIMKVRHSGDDYKTWSSYRSVDLSKTRAQLYLGGQDRRRSWEFLCTDPQPLRLLAAEIEFDIGGIENEAQQPPQYRK